MFYFTLINLSLGDLALLWHIHAQLPLLIRVQLPEADISALDLLKQSYPEVSQASHPLIDRIGEQLEAFDQGRDIDFSIPESGPRPVSDFYRRVWTATSHISRGTVCTYGQLADAIAAPRAARAVGTALAANPFPLLIPCHRVILASGDLGNYSAGGPRVKRSLLEREGVLFDRHGRVIKPQTHKRSDVRSPKNP